MPMIIKTRKKSKMILLAVASLLICSVFFGCSQSTPELSPMPAIDMAKSTIADTKLTKEQPKDTPMLQKLSPIELATPLKELENQGSNIENNGIAANSEGTIYFLQDGLKSMSTNGYHREILSEQGDMLYLNIYEDYIYYVSSNDYSVYRVEEENLDSPKPLNISGAYAVMIIQEHIYFQNAIGENADNYVYRTDLDGLNPENLMIKASVFCSDGQKIFFANQEDENKLYSLDTCTGEIEQLSNNQVSQLNVIDGNIYYINKTTKLITKLNTETLESTILSQENCSYLNNNGDILVFYSNTTNLLGTISIESGEINYILEYNDVNGLNVAGDWIFFESYENSFQEEVFFLKTDGTQLSKDLPDSSLARIIDYNADENIVYCDFVKYLNGKSALEEYIKDNGVSERKAQEILAETNGVYIQNKYPQISQYKLSDLTDIELNIKADSSLAPEGYSANVALFEEIYSRDIRLILDQLYYITGYEGQMIKIEQFYTP